MNFSITQSKSGRTGASNIEGAWPFDSSRTFLKGRMTQTKTDRRDRVTRTWIAEDWRKAGPMKSQGSTWSRVVELETNQ